MKELVEPVDDEREREREGEASKVYEWEQRLIYIVPCAWRIQV